MGRGDGSAIKRFVHDSVQPYEELERQQEAMLRSFEERSEIWARGGRGWWSEDDLSKIIWPATGN
jgi:hypothetical protein